jgi:hypothetical protein
MSEDFSKHPQEQRSDNDRRDGLRKTAERRKMLHGVQLKFTGSLLEIEDWLDDNSQGDCELVIVEVSDDMSQKTIQVMFELLDDREKFKADVGRF